jgi:alkylresorcinol/alkylpyrone synthase
VKVIDAPQLSAPAASRWAPPSPLTDDAAMALAARRVGTRISRLAIADAETSFSQDEVLALLGMTGDEFAERIFSRCGVKRRHLNLTGDFLATTLQGRTPQIEEELFELAVQAVERLEIDPLEIGTVVTATLYSLGGPTLAHRIVDHFQMDPATDKYHLVGVGCASAVPLMRLVSQSLHHPRKQGLIVAAESMAGILMRSSAGDSKAQVVGSSIFGDGCAAALLTDDPYAEGPVIVASKVHQIGNTLGAVHMELAAENSYLHLDRDLPDVAAAGLHDLVENFLDRNGVSSSAIDHWMVHPGGRRIIECVQAALALSDEDVSVSYDLLANYGNVGTPSIFYVLKETIEQREPRPGDRGLVVTIGPGITVGLMLLEW